MRTVAKDKWNGVIRVFWREAHRSCRFLIHFKTAICGSQPFACVPMSPSCLPVWPSVCLCSRPFVRVTVRFPVWPFSVDPFVRLPDIKCFADTLKEVL